MCLGDVLLRSTSNTLIDVSHGYQLNKTIFTQSFPNHNEKSYLFGVDIMFSIETKSLNGLACNVIMNSRIVLPYFIRLKQHDVFIVMRTVATSH
jgi:hypothetical protein